LPELPLYSITKLDAIPAGCRDLQAIPRRGDLSGTLGLAVPVGNTREQEFGVTGDQEFRSEQEIRRGEPAVALPPMIERKAPGAWSAVVRHS
jgi:hypothetical protein